LWTIKACTHSHCSQDECLHCFCRYCSLFGWVLSSSLWSVWSGPLQCRDVCDKCVPGNYVQAGSCQPCPDCSTVLGPMGIYYGVCGGPDHDFGYPCLTPGQALCAACPFQFNSTSDWPEELFEDHAVIYGCLDPVPDNSFWDFPPTPTQTLDSCCDAIKLIALNDTSDCENPDDPHPQRYRWHCLFLLLEDCMGLRSKNPCWAVPPLSP